MGKDVLLASDLGFRYKGSGWLFRHLTVLSPPAAVLAVTGPSGSGKSTLLALLGDLLSPAEGTVHVDSRACTWVFQLPSGLARRTAIDHVTLPLLAMGHSRRVAAPRAEALLETVGLARRMSAQFRELSGGEAQRLSLARALATGSQILLVDEPTAQLDRGTAQSIAGTLANVADHGRIVVVATHDPILVGAASAVLNLSSTYAAVDL